MLPLSLRKGIFSARNYSQSKFLINRYSLVEKCVLSCSCTSEVRGKRDVSSIKPREVKANNDELQIGAELSGKIKVVDVHQIVMNFLSRPELDKLSSEEGLSDQIVRATKASFRKYCCEVKKIPTDLYIILSDLINGHGHILDLSPYFLQHAQRIFPHLKYKDELTLIGDLTNPAHCFKAARKIKRKLFLHYGPTNSGKTYSAIKSFFQAERAVYCAPLKLLAHEIYLKANDQNVPCDLITGEEIKRVHGPDLEANHVSCTIEMVSVTQEYDVAVIDEIQMLRDSKRGFAWTRALLGIVAKEIHLCGEESAVNYIKNVAYELGEDVECFYYKRLTKLTVEERPVENFKNIMDGDCIICFTRRDIYNVRRELEKLGRKCAIVYGNLPPAVKTAQTKIFNDPTEKCKTLVATDAIGLGINLNIRRIVFYGLRKKGEINGVVSVSLARQIAGRAGRFGSSYQNGYVAAFWKNDLATLKQLLEQNPEDVTRAGLIPSPEQIELFSYFLPGLDLLELVDTFISLSTTDESKYFMCDMSNLRFLAEKLKSIPLTVKTAFSICFAPVNITSTISVVVFVKFAKKISQNEMVPCSLLMTSIGWPLKKPNTFTQLTYLEEVSTILDMYLWFGIRFPDIFAETLLVKDLQAEIDLLILEGVSDLIKIVEAEEIDKKNENITNRHKNLVNLVERGILSKSAVSTLKKEWEVAEGKKNLCDQRQRKRK